MSEGVVVSVSFCLVSWWVRSRLVLGVLVWREVMGDVFIKKFCEVFERMCVSECELSE